MINLHKHQLIKHSLVMAHLAKSCYSKHSYETFAEFGYDNDYRIVQNKWTFAHVGSNSNRVVIAIKGTNTKQLRDFIADIDIWPVDHGCCRVHRGFRKRTESIINLITSYLDKHHGKEIIITGHSLGAAVALLLTGELELLGYNNITLFTFGMPRVGNKAYCELIKSTHHRFVNCNDIVPKIPTSLMGYRHHGKLHYLNFYGEIRDLTPWQRVKDRFRARMYTWKKGRIFDNFADHKMTAYIKKLSDLSAIE